MWTQVLPDQLAELPIGELATATTPDRWHDALQALGTHCRDGSWVVSGPGPVSAALSSPALSVTPPSQPSPAGSAAALIATTARFSHGRDHARRRDLVTRLLPSVPDLITTVGARANYYLRRRTAPFDVMPMARTLPTEVLAAALGLPPAQSERAAELTAVLCDAIAPMLEARPGTGLDPDSAARELAAVMAQLPSCADEEELAAAISILFQARDATAGLIGAAVLAGSGSGATASGPSVSAAQRVEHVLRHEAPVQCTRRTALADVLVGEAMIPAGAPVWVFAATAERGSGRPATFGMGPHGCPGAVHAIAIARQVVTVLAAEGWHAVSGQRIDFERRPNIRVPRRVLVARS